MKKFIFINENGIPINTAMPSDDTQFISGTTYGNVLCLQIPIDTDDTLFLSTKYWKGAWKDRLSQPSRYHTWDIVSESWIDTRSLQDFKNNKWDEIKKARDAEKVSPLVTVYGTLDAGILSQKNITDAILMLQTLSNMGTPTTIDFTMYDNSIVTMDLSMIISIGLTLGQRTQALQVKGTLLRAQIDAATTIPEVLAITWPVN